MVSATSLPLETFDRDHGCLHTGVQSLDATTYVGLILVVVLAIALSPLSPVPYRNLMQDLLEDVSRTGVTIKSRRHGNPQNVVKELRQSLRQYHQRPDVAEAIKAVKGKKRTYVLTIPYNKIGCRPPKT